MFKWMQKSLRDVVFSCLHLSGTPSLAARCSMRHGRMQIEWRHRRRRISRRHFSWFLFLFNFMQKWLTAFNWIPLSFQLMVEMKRERNETTDSFRFSISSFLPSFVRFLAFLLILFEASRGLLSIGVFIFYLSRFIHAFLVFEAANRRENEKSEEKREEMRCDMPNANRNNSSFLVSKKKEFRLHEIVKEKKRKKIGFGTSVERGGEETELVGGLFRDKPPQQRWYRE